MITWLYRFLLFVLLFGVSALSHGGNTLSPLLDKATSGVTLLGILALVVCYFHYPRFYKMMAWPLLLGVILLILESKYEYGQYVYSYFVIKRFAYCGLALSAYYVATKAGEFRFEYIIYLIFAFFFINQILLGQIFSYTLDSDSRTTTAPEALYLVLPFLYFLVLYLKEHRLLHLGLCLFSFALIVFLLHRSVISTAVGAAGIVFMLAMAGRLSSDGKGLPIGRTLATFGVMLLLVAPFIGLLPEKKFESFQESMNGLIDPKEDNTGSWRVEQSEFYISLIPDRPLLGWRYDGYDRGEIMENEDFPQKGTIIHSQYVDMLYNYGFVGLLINLLLIGGTLVAIYRHNRICTTEQLVLFGFVASGLVYGISYQLPVYFWGFVGLGMFYGLHRPALQRVIHYPLETPRPAYPTDVVFSKNQISL
ncbi:O-antigen ligase family protein [Spirosoma koreense]